MRHLWLAAAIAFLPSLTSAQTTQPAPHERTLTAGQWSVADLFQRMGQTTDLDFVLDPPVLNSDPIQIPEAIPEFNAAVGRALLGQCGFRFKQSAGQLIVTRVQTTSPKEKPASQPPAMMTAGHIPIGAFLLFLEDRFAKLNYDRQHPRLMHSILVPSDSDNLDFRLARAILEQHGCHFRRVEGAENEWHIDLFYVVTVNPQPLTLTLASPGKGTSEAKVMLRSEYGPLPVAIGKVIVQKAAQEFIEVVIDKESKGSTLHFKVKKASADKRNDVVFVRFGRGWPPVQVKVINGGDANRPATRKDRR